LREGGAGGSEGRRACGMEFVFGGDEEGEVGDETRGKNLIGLKMLVAFGLGLAAVAVPAVLVLPRDLLDGKIEGLEGGRTLVITA